MEIWGIILILILIALAIGLVLGIYYTIKSQHYNNLQLLDKALKLNDQSIASFCLGPSHYIKRPQSQQPNNFVESFIDDTKEQPSRVGIASTGIGTERPKLKEESEIAPRTDRSIDFLLLSTTRRANANTTKTSHRGEHAELDMSFLKTKLENEKANELRDEINQIEKDIASKSRLTLFKLQIKNELLHYHYILALLKPAQRKKPLPHYATLNTSLYLILLFLLSLIAPPLGAGASLVILGCLFTGVTLPFLILSHQNLEDESSSFEIQHDSKNIEDPVEDKAIAFLHIFQKKFLQNTFPKLFCMTGLACGFAFLSRVPKFEAAITESVFIAFIITIVVDVLILRNIVIAGMTFGFLKTLQKNVLKERIQELMKAKAGQTGINCMNEANKKLFTIQQEAKENYPSSENTEIRPHLLGDSYSRRQRHVGDIMNLSENKDNRVDTDTMLSDATPANAREYNSQKYRPVSFSGKINGEEIIPNNELFVNPPKEKTHEEKLMSIKVKSKRGLPPRDPSHEEKNKTENNKQEIKGVKKGEKNKNEAKKQEIKAAVQKVEKKPKQTETEKETTKKRRKQSQEILPLPAHLVEMNTVLNTSLELAKKEIKGSPSPKKNLRNKENECIYTENQSVEKELPLSIPSVAFNDNLFHSVSSDRKKKNVVIPSLAEKITVVPSQTSTTLNTLKDIDSRRTLSKQELDKRSHANIHTQTQDPGTPISNYPPSFNYLEQERTSHRGSRRRTDASIQASTSRASIGTEFEIRHDHEDWAKYMNRRPDRTVDSSELGSIDSKRLEYKSSTRESKLSNRGLRPAHENGYIIKETKITENEVEESGAGGEWKPDHKGSDWLPYAVRLKKPREARRSLEMPDVKSKNKFEEIERIENNRVRKLGSRDYLVVPGMNIEKVAPKTYEYKIQHMRSQSKETGFDRLKSRRSSMEKVEEANTKLPKIPKGSHSRDNSLKDRREKRNVRSLSKVPSLPEVKGVAKSQAAFI